MQSVLSMFRGDRDEPVFSSSAETGDIIGLGENHFMTRLPWLTIGLCSAVYSLYAQNNLSADRRAEDLLARMTLAEKVGLLAGVGWMETKPIPRLGIPALKMADGPMGVRSWAGPSAQTNAAGSTLLQVETTSFPSGTAMAATWNPDLVERQGRAIGQEVRALGRNMLLGPTVNIQRVPLWGRNFEGYGEDPYLASRLGVAYIRGVQSQGVIATVKHFAANNQEFERHRIDEKISERALHEIYLPAFKAAVEEAGVWAVMSAYNKVNGLHAAENPYLLTDTLRDKWGFKGFVVSDWGGTYSTAGSLKAGLSLEMPGGELMRTWISLPRTQASGNGGGWLAPEKVLAEVKAGRVSEQVINERVEPTLRAMFATGLFERSEASAGEVDTPEQRALARAAAGESIVLLKNVGAVLPLDAGKLRSIAVIGPNAAVARTGGGGSSLVRPKYAVTPLDGIREQAGSRVQMAYALGVSMAGEDASKDTPAVREQLRKEAVAAAAKADAAIVVVGYSPALESEAFDRKSLDLPAGQDELIQAVAAVNKNTIVVLNAGSPVTMGQWLDRVPAVVDAWYGGQEGGHAIADVLFGAANPSGKLPVTFPKSWQNTAAYGHYPGENLHVDYAEGIYVGYRHFDTHNVEPLFPFGYGLSYTTFAYSNLKVMPRKVTQGTPVEVSLQVRNTGSRAGAAVIQLYLHDVQASVDRPAKELKAFRKVMLAPGQAQTVMLTLEPNAMAFWDPAKKDWVSEPGRFEVLIGASSRDIRLKQSFELER
jgi:beta-glucosidase